jgi:hypothetical protein
LFFSISTCFNGIVPVGCFPQFWWPAYKYREITPDGGTTAGRIGAGAGNKSPFSLNLYGFQGLNETKPQPLRNTG